MLFWPAEILLLYNFLESDTKVPARGHRKHMHLRTAQSGTIFFFLDFPCALRHHAPIPPRKTRDVHLNATYLTRPLSRVCLAEWISRRGRRDDFKMKTMRSTYIALFGVLLLVAGSFTVWAQAAQQPAAQSQPDSSTAAKAKKKKKTDSASETSTKKSTTKKAGAADRSATAGSSTTPKKTSSKKSAAPATAQSAAAPADSATPKKTRSKKFTASAVPATTAPAAAAPATTPAKSTTGAPAATPAASTAPVTSPAATPAAPASAPAVKKATAQQAPPANSAGTVWVNTDSGVYHKPGTRWYGKTKQGKYMTEGDAQKAGYRAAAKE